MNASRWSSVAVALAAGTLGFLATGCDDPPTGEKDMASAQDMSVPPSPDLSAPPDMALRVQGTGQVIIADVVGSLWAPNGVGGEMEVPFAHVMPAFAFFPPFQEIYDFYDQQIAPGMSRGCAVGRYDLTAGKGPPTDAESGLVTISGYESRMFSLAPGQMSPSGPPIPTQIFCNRGASPNLYYGCAFGMPNQDGGALGAPPAATAFPPIPLTNYTAACAVAGTCPPCDQTGHPGICEQHPIPNGGTASITTNVVGGTEGYGPGMKSWASGNKPVPDAFTIISIKVGGTSIGSTDLKDLNNKLDPTKDLSITWSCDGTLTPGSGCSTAGLFDFAVLLLATSKDVRSAFSTPPVTTKFGLGNCVEQANSASATVTVKAAAVAALLGTPKQVGGSVNILFLHMLGQPVMPSFPANKITFLAAGHGQIGFANLP